MSTLTSGEFTDLPGFRRERTAIREGVMSAHGIQPGQRARLHPAALVLEILIDGRWVGFTNSMPDAADRVKVNQHVRPVPSRFRLTHRLPRAAAESREAGLDRSACTV